MILKDLILVFNHVSPKIGLVIYQNTRVTYQNQSRKHVRCLLCFSKGITAIQNSTRSLDQIRTNNITWGSSGNSNPIVDTCLPLSHTMYLRSKLITWKKWQNHFKPLIHCCLNCFTFSRHFRNSKVARMPIEQLIVFARVIWWTQNVCLVV